MDRRFARVHTSQIHVAPRALTSIAQVAGRSSTVVPQREHETRGASSVIPAVWPKALAPVRRLEGC